MKKIIGIMLITITGLTLITGCGCNKKEKEKEKEPEIEVNTNKDVIKDQELEVFTFKNTSLVYENGTSTLQTVVTNTGSKTEYLKEFKIHVKDKDGKEIVELTGFIGSNIEAGESRTISSSYGANLTESTSIEYEIVR